MKLISNILLLFVLSLSCLNAKKFIVDDTNYRDTLSELKPGDTLLLKAGTYKEGLPLVDLHGTEEQPIVIIGDDNHSTLLLGRPSNNTVSITRCSYLTIMNLEINGLGEYSDGVKAEGTEGNYAHNIILENLLIVQHQKNMQHVGISTKCPAWDWTIRNCTIDFAGTGIYLGNSDGTAPFINGIIEHNLIKNTIGYNIEIKHQNEGLRTVPGMTKNGRTIIRYNVFSREPVPSLTQSSRPNLLVGNFPVSGDGSQDIYELYGNFFWQNPKEALFQGTGNIALYSNIFINNYESEDYRAVYITKHNNFKPRKIYIFHNTVWAKNIKGGIRLFSADDEYSQYAWANAVFSELPITNVDDVFENVTDGYGAAGDYLNNASEDIALLDVYPKDSKLFAEAVDMDIFSGFTDYDLDYNGEKYSTAFRGAYSGMGVNPGWKLKIEKRPPIGSTTSIEEKAKPTKGFLITPNPATDYIEIALNNVILNVVKYTKYSEAHPFLNVEIYDVLGELVTTALAVPLHSGEGSRVRIDVSALAPGVYLVKFDSFIAKFIKI